MNDQAPVSDETSETYFVRRRGKVEGPWRSEKLKAEVKLRKLSKFHEVSSDNRSWSRAETLPWLFPKMNLPNHSKSETEANSNAGTGISQSTSSRELVSSWYVGINGEEVGPMTTKEVVSKIANCVLGPTDLVWQDGYPDWIALGSVPEFAPLVRELASEHSEEFRLDISDVPKLDAGESTGGRIAFLSTPSFVLGLIAFPALPIFSFVCGLFLPLASLLFLLSVPVGIIAGILGVLACREISKSQHQLKGKRRAVVGIITGFGAAIGTILFLTALIVAMFYFR